MRSLYGHGLVQDAFSYISEHQQSGTSVIPLKVLTAFAFAGGCFTTLVISIPLLRQSINWLAGVIIPVLLLPCAWFLSRSLSASAEISTHLAITFWGALLILGGVVALGLPILDWKRNKTPDAALLLLWVWGTFAFCIFNWSINGRSVLPMAPAVAILLLRQIESDPTVKKRRLNWVLGTAALLSLVVAFADYRLANSARTAVADIRTRFSNGSSTTIWFQGHWGFQYYAEKEGWRSFDSIHPSTQPGDLIILPVNNTNLKPISENTIGQVWSIDVPVWPWISTMSRPLGAGFYMDTLGPFPFSFGVVPSEKYYIVKLK